jgi:hypothetical protein
VRNHVGNIQNRAATQPFDSARTALRAVFFSE